VRWVCVAVTSRVALAPLMRTRSLRSEMLAASTKQASIHPLCIPEKELYARINSTLRAWPAQSVSLDGVEKINRSHTSKYRA